MKLGSFIVGLMAVGLIVSVISIFYAGLSVSYNVDYNETKYSIYDQSAALLNQTKDMNSTLNDLNPTDSSATSFVNAFLGSGWTVIKTTFKSFGIFNSLADATVEKANLGEGTANFMNYIKLIALVIFFMIIIGILVGKELI